MRYTYSCPLGTRYTRTPRNAYALHTERIHCVPHRETCFTAPHCGCLCAQVQLLMSYGNGHPLDQPSLMQVGARQGL